MYTYNSDNKLYYVKTVSTYPLKTRLLVTGELLQIEDAAVLSAHSPAAASESKIKTDTI